MAPAADVRNKNRKENQAGELHVQRGAQRPDAPRNKARKKIRTAPRQGSQQTKKNSHAA
jgi:hypothetical protein